MSGEFLPSVCPHDCPSACALEAERLDARTIGRVRGAGDNAYTRGVVCAKVSRYAERVHHPDRLTTPLRRVGAKGEGRFEPISWDEALDTVAAEFNAAAERFGPETVWAYYYGGTMGLVQKRGILRLTRLMGYSGMERTICATPAKFGWLAGAGRLAGVDPREILDSELVVFWGCNAVATQIHTMNLAMEARRENGAKVIVVDPYRNRTAAMADQHLAVKPGTDGALACAVMHVLFAEGLADRDYLAAFTDRPEDLEAHLKTRGPAWAAGITGLSEEEIVSFAQAYGSTKKSFLRLGLGFSRSRNGPANVHAVSCLPAVTGAWKEKGGGALMMSSGVFHVDTAFVDGLDADRPDTRMLDMSRLGAILAGEEADLQGGPPVTAMIMQNTNPAVVNPDSARVREGLLRDDLFLCVHEQLPTETTKYADIVLPATTFLEHDDLYTSYGQSFLQVGKRVIEPLPGARSNHLVLSALMERLGTSHPANDMNAWQLIDRTLSDSGYGDADTLAEERWLDCAVDFDTAHFLKGFGHEDGKFRFAPDWAALGPLGASMPDFPDHMETIEAADETHPFRLVTAPARNFLNTSFTEAPTSVKSEGRPTARIHPDDCAELGLAEGDAVRLGNRRGSVVVHTQPFDGLQRGVVVVESIWPESAFVEGRGINTLIGAEPIPPAGGAAFHDCAVRMEKA